MKFALDEQQLGLQSSVRRLLDDRSTLAQVRAFGDSDTGHDPDLWKRMGEDLGLLAIGVPEQFGGMGGSFVDQAVVLEQLGRALTPSPYFSSAVLATRTLLAADDEAAAQRWLPDLAEGRAIGTLALLEGAGSWSSASALQTTARRVDGAWVVDGTKTFVTDGHVADLLLVLAEAPEGPTLLAVMSTAAGVTSVREDSLDRTRALATVTFASAEAQQVGAAGEGRAAVERALQVAAIGLACEQAGGAARCLEMAVDYAKVRVQFDRPIGSFQAVKHMLADRLLDNESAHAAAFYAAWAVDASSDEVAVLSSLTQAFCSDAYFDAAAVNIQVHGGIGFTWEHDAHLFFKRATTDKQLLGAPNHHRELLARHVVDAVPART